MDSNFHGGRLIPKTCFEKTSITFRNSWRMRKFSVRKSRICWTSSTRIFAELKQHWTFDKKVPTNFVTWIKCIFIGSIFFNPSSANLEQVRKQVWTGRYQCKNRFGQVPNRFILTQNRFGQVAISARTGLDRFRTGSFFHTIHFRKTKTSKSKFRKIWKFFVWTQKKKSPDKMKILHEYLSLAPGSPDKEVS